MPAMLLLRVANEENQPVNPELRLDAHLDAVRSGADTYRPAIPAAGDPPETGPRSLGDLDDLGRPQFAHLCRGQLTLVPMASLAELYSFQSTASHALASGPVS